LRPFPQLPPLDPFSYLPLRPPSFVGLSIFKRMLIVSNYIPSFSGANVGCIRGRYMLFPHCYYHQTEGREIRESGLFEVVVFSGRQSL
jgi:hypothetical protein